MAESGTCPLLATDDGRFVPRLVHVKFHAGDDVAIESGLSGGEKIVTSGNFLIDSESRLKDVAEPAAEGAPAKPKSPSCPKGQHTPNRRTGLRCHIRYG